ncbi:hypothetical protein FQA47_003584 [Oryzias melastigma]|uniref:Uncharacterized protein n=1 Tax=Oryzias melastigma TaxID=30732 RepID=A0A834CAG1_ORYME|nr:hypothetical protein FQA47_003584 [Oryzias melastigma]
MRRTCSPDPTRSGRLSPTTSSAAPPPPRGHDPQHETRSHSKTFCLKGHFSRIRPAMPPPAGGSDPPTSSVRYTQSQNKKPGHKPAEPPRTGGIAAVLAGSIPNFYTSKCP